jgi:CDGSH-type Zn-finger protein
MAKKREHKASVDCSRNGPYLVRGLEYLRNSKGEELQVRKVVALCRCGHSGNKPFCDGTHAKIEFSGERLRKRPPTAKQDRYPGKGITILDNRTVCAHIGKCTDGLPAVWRLKETPWIKADAAEREEIIEVIRQCPSGALSYEGEPPVDRGVGITVLKDGPYYVTGGFALDDPVTEQTPQDPDEYTLCRCGASRNKPFCDGAHWDIEFRDDDN